MAKDKFHQQSESSEVLPLLTGCRRNTYLAAGSALLYAIVFGMVATYSSPACVDMKREGSRFVDITNEQIAWIASLPPLSGIVGNAIAGEFNSFPDDQTSSCEFDIPTLQ